MTQANNAAVASATETRTAAGRRARRVAAAQLFGACTFRSELEWSHLEHLPDWAALPQQALANFEWVTGAWAHGPSLRRCIDGKILASVRQRLGDSGMVALIASSETEAAAQGGGPSLDVSQCRPKDLDEVFTTTGRDWLMASVMVPTLRRALRERLWPGTADVAVDKMPNSARAQAVVQAVMVAFGAAA